MVDPFELHPLTPSLEKKRNNVLTLRQVRETIDKQIETVESLSPKTWGFKREEILKHLRKVLEDLEKKCQKNL